MSTPALMLQGTGSDVGKSLMVAGLGRLFARRGLSVRPFKPQNMSNNAAVTADGGEIGRAQALQARACLVEPSIDMNPVLIKPQTDTGAQIIVHGKIFAEACAKDYLGLKSTLLPLVMESYGRLSEGCDLVLIEGAGSPAEVNLRKADIANMGFAQAADVPVVLLGDIDRGGVIASIVGTWELLNSGERERLKGFIINKFRGDISLFDGGIEAIVERTGLTGFGTVPFFHQARQLPAEDAIDLDAYGSKQGGGIKIVIPVLSRISNFDDFDPLAAEPDVEVSFVYGGKALPGDADLVILPGTKSSIGDLNFLRSQGWDIDIAAHHRRGGAVLGICGGYQMLGRTLADPGGIEGAPGEAPGLGLLDVDTVLGGDKRLVAVSGTELPSNEAIEGYEMHVGTTTGPATKRPMLRLKTGEDGALSKDGLIAGCYVHGLFAGDAFRHAFLGRLRQREASGLRYEAMLEGILDAFADHLQAHLDIDGLLALARGEQGA